MKDFVEIQFTEEEMEEQIELEKKRRRLAPNAYARDDGMATFDLWYQQFGGMRTYKEICQDEEKPANINTLLLVDHLKLKIINYIKQKRR